MKTRAAELGVAAAAGVGTIASDGMAFAGGAIGANVGGGGGSGGGTTNGFGVGN